MKTTVRFAPLVLAVALAAAAAAASAGAARAAADRPMGRPGAEMRAPGAPGRGMALIEQLRLTDAQRQELRDQHFKSARQAIQVRAKLQEARLSLAQLMTADRLDAAAIRSQGSQIAELQAQLTRNRIENRLAMLSVLTVDQRHQLRQSGVRQVIRRRMIRTGSMDELDGRPGQDDPMGYLDELSAPPGVPPLPGGPPGEDESE